MTRWETYAPTPGASHADPLVDRLFALLGPGRVAVVTRPDRPRALVSPDHTDAVSQVLRALHESGVPFRVAATPPPFDPPEFPKGGVWLSLERLSALLAVDETSLVAGVQAGARWGALEALLARRGLTLGPIPAWLRGISIAESVARNDRLRPSPRYGQLTDALQSVTAALPDGAVARTAAAPRRATGPDLPSTMLGAHHRAGVLTEVQLQLARRPSERPRLAFDSPDWVAADALCRRLLQAGHRPAMWRAAGVGPVVTCAEMASDDDAHALERTLKAWGVGLRFGAPALDLALAESGPTSEPPAFQALVPPTALPAVLKVLPGAEVWEPGTPLVSVWASARPDDVTCRRLAELGAKLAGLPTGFEALGESVARLLGGHF